MPMTLTSTLSAGLACETAMRDPVPFDHVHEARQIEHIAELEVDVIENVGNERLVAMAGKDDRPVSLVHEPAARLRAHDAHPAGDQYLHAFTAPSLLSCIAAARVPDAAQRERIHQRRHYCGRRQRAAVRR